MLRRGPPVPVRRPAGPEAHRGSLGGKPGVGVAVGARADAIMARAMVGRLDRACEACRGKSSANRMRKSQAALQA